MVGVTSPLRSLAGLLENYRFLTPWMRIKNPVSNGLSRDRFWAGYLTPLPSNVNANLSVGSIPTFLIRSDSFGRHQSWGLPPIFLKRPLPYPGSILGEPPGCNDDTVTELVP